MLRMIIKIKKFELVQKVLVKNVVISVNRF